jgi:hypothetical protein
MTCNKTVTANFTLINPTTYTLTVLVSPNGGGAVTLNPSQPPEGYLTNTVVTLTAVASGGYEFDHWSGNLSGSQNPASIQMTSAKTVTAHFVETTYALSVGVSPDGGGVVTLDPSQPAEGYAAGTEVTLTAVASGGYEFDHWSGALSGSENPTNITMDSDKEVTAHFTQITYTLTVDVSPPGGGTVTLEPSPPAEGYVVGTEVTLTAVTSEGYEFDHWSGSLSGLENPTVITMDSDKEVTAHFTQTTYTLTVSISPTDSGTVTLEPSPPAEGYVVGTEVTLTAVAGEGYEFDHWSGALSGSENPTSITMDSDKEVTAHFAQITYTLTVGVNPSGGTVTLEPSPPAGGYVVGTEITLTAVADEGYEFDHWSGALSGSENPTVITMDSDREITAHFTEVTPSSFPWWWIVVGVGVVGIGLLFYFLVIKVLRA